MITGIVAQANAEIDKRGWTVQMFSAEELLESGGGKVGFVKPNETKEQG